VAKEYYKTRAAVSVNEEDKALLLSFAKNLTEILPVSKREEDLVTPMARAAAHVKPQVYQLEEEAQEEAAYEKRT
jgi:hypothetical protein